MNILNRLWRSRAHARITALELNVLSLDHQVTHMTQQTDAIKADLDLIKTGVTNLQTQATAQAAAIADLQAKQAAGGTITDADLAPIKQEADDIVTQLAGLTAPAPATT